MGRAEGMSISPYRWPRDLSLGAGVQLRWVLGSLLVEKALGWKGAEMNHRRGKEGWVGAGQAVLARPACSIWKADLLGHGRRDSNGDKKTFHIWTKSPERPGPAASPGCLPPPPVSLWAPSPEPCPTSLTLGPQATLWPPPQLSGHLPCGQAWAMGAGEETPSVGP